MRVLFFIILLIFTESSYGMTVDSDEGLAYITDQITKTYCNKIAEYKAPKIYPKAILLPVMASDYKNTPEFEAWSIKFDDLLYKGILNCLISKLGKHDESGYTFSLVPASSFIIAAKFRVFDPLDAYKNPLFLQSSYLSITGSGLSIKQGIRQSKDSPAGDRPEPHNLAIITKLKQTGLEVLHTIIKQLSIEYQIVDEKNISSDFVDISLP